MSGTVVTRTLAATPGALATETWAKVVELVAPSGASGVADARAELARVGGVVCSCITDGAIRDDAITVYGSGPRVRIYCLYDDESLDAEQVQDAPLSFVAASGDWRMSVPCVEEDLDWVQRSLANVSERVTARVVGDGVGEEERSLGKTAGAFVVDVEAFRRS